MVEIDRLLTPISEESPTGAYLKLDRSAYRGLRNNYNAAQSSFRQLIETPDASSDEALLDANQTNWQQLRESTFDALTQSTKDIELLGWFISSQLFTAQPYQNLADSTKVLTGFIEQFWTELHPTLPENKIKSDDEQGKAKELAEFRIKPLLQLVGESNDSTALFMPLQLIGLIEEITFGDYLRAERSGSLAELKQKAQQLFSSEVEQTVMLLAESYQNFSQAELAIAQQCQQVGVTPISFRFVKANIADSINAIRYLTGDKFALWPLDENLQPRQEDVAEPTPAVSEPATVSEAVVETAPAAPTESQVAAPATSTVAPVAAPQVQAAAPVAQPLSLSQVASRDQAFQQIREISEFFKQTEPHSPISFLLERAIRWGYMSLPELIEEMTGGNSGVVQHINQLTGMDNLNQVDLSNKATQQTAVANNNAITNNDTQLTKEPTPSVEVTQPEAVNTTKPTQTEATSAQSSGGLTDFEW
ncbi:ImpA family type VI secretion system protein [Vibrio brasiliensis]|uniref:type VI secretion system protein TssA n=1 Tax=Vibrio brasiliensis TaxID=170652 RepID=UPI001EFE5B79|nr:type VI secretion system ImpA family N-terminal domain-containing protein [Vibrio brasiliensis]MCG9724767.1 type VI secretion system ImpA family N-terminal domain-containing protein [Vibrio brasiliensis]